MDSKDVSSLVGVLFVMTLFVGGFLLAEHPPKHGLKGLLVAGAEKVKTVADPFINAVGFFWEGSPEPERDYSVRVYPYELQMRKLEVMQADIDQAMAQGLTSPRLLALRAEVVRRIEALREAMAERFEGVKKKGEWR